MKKRFRKPNGQAKKWIETSYAKKYIVARSLHRGYLGLIAVSMVTRVKMLASTSANTPIEKFEKSKAIAQAIIDGHTAMNKALTLFAMR